MELKRIEIKNFRSIKDATVDFDHNCKVLVGKNDAGKSNVLKAIAAVFDEYQVTPNVFATKSGTQVLDNHYQNLN